MKEQLIAGMQPYFFPYIGYFQLINTVDKFVIYDDGTMITNGYIHRNFVLNQDGTGRVQIGLCLKKGKYLCKINEMELADNTKNFRKIKDILYHRYHKAPYYETVSTLINDCLSYNERNMVHFLVNSLHQTCNYIGIDTPFVFSSEVSKEGLEHIEEKVFRICDHFGIHHNVNPIGGMELYNKDYWREHGVELSFIRRNDDIRYKQFNYPFVRDLSVIDVMMFNSPEQIRQILQQYTLL